MASDPVFAYNSSSDTCLCRYSVHIMTRGASGTNRIVADTLKNAVIAEFDTAEFDTPESRAMNRKREKHYAATVAAMDKDRVLPEVPNE